MFQEGEPSEPQKPEEPQDEIEEGVEEESSEPTPEEIINAFEKIFSEALENASEKDRIMLLREMTGSDFSPYELKQIPEGEPVALTYLSRVPGKEVVGGDFSHDLSSIFKQLFEKYLEELKSGEKTPFDLLEELIPIYSVLGYDEGDLFTQLTEKGILE